MSGHETSTEDAGALKLSLGVYVLSFVLKLGVYFATGVVAILAEALHTLSDVFVAGFLLAALWVSKADSDEDHPFGHGRAQYVGALVAATLFISFTAFELFREALPRLFTHHEAEHKNLGLAIGVLVLSMGLAAIPLVVLLKKKPSGASAKAQLLELVNDQLGLAAALVATIAVMYGHPIADPLAALFVAVIIAANGVGLFRENASYLLGRSPEPEVMRRFEEAVRSVPGVNGMHGLRAQLIGPEHVHGEVHVEVSEGLTVAEGHRIAFEVRQAVRKAVPGSDCVVHVDTHPPGDAARMGEVNEA